MKRITAIFSVITALFAMALPASAAELSTFKNLTAYASSDGFSLVLAFDGKLSERLRFSEKHIEIDFSESRMSTPKKTYDISRAGIGTVEVAQLNAGMVRVRIKPDGDIKALGRSMSLEKRGGKLILKFAAPNSPVAPVAPVAPKQAVAQQKEVSSVVTADSLQAKNGQLKKGRVSSLRVSAGRVSAGGEGNQPASATKGTLRRGGPASAPMPDSLARETAASELKAALSDVSLSVAADKKPVKGLFADYSEPEVPEVPSLGESLVKVGGALAVVLAMVLILAFAAKRYLSGAKSALSAQKQLTVLSTHFIGVKKSVTLVEIAGEVLALGVTNENINLLARYDDPEKIEQIKMTHRLPDKPLGVFKKLPGFSKISGAKGGKKRAFIKEVESRTRAMNEREKELAGKRDAAREELVSKAAGTIASRHRKLEKAAG